MMTGRRQRARDRRATADKAESDRVSDARDGASQIPAEAAPRSVIICDGDGGTLTEATIRLDGGARMIVLAEIAESHALMRYYFGGGNLVFVVCDGSSAEGRLETRWHGLGRTWMVRLTTTLPRHDSAVEPSSNQLILTTPLAAGTARHS
jgi:hypothetical protein